MCKTQEFACINLFNPPKTLKQGLYYQYFTQKKLKAQKTNNSPRLIMQLCDRVGIKTRKSDSRASPFNQGNALLQWK